MVPQSSLLLALVDPIDVIPNPPGPRWNRSRGGRPAVYSDRLFLKALVIMLVRNVSTVGGLIATLEQPTWEMEAWRTRGRSGEYRLDVAELNEAAIEGWLVLRVSVGQIREGAAVALVARALE